MCVGRRGGKVEPKKALATQETPRSPRNPKKPQETPKKTKNTKKAREPQNKGEYRGYGIEYESPSEVASLAASEENAEKPRKPETQETQELNNSRKQQKPTPEKPRNSKKQETARPRSRPRSRPPKTRQRKRKLITLLPTWPDFELQIHFFDPNHENTPRVQLVFAKSDRKHFLVGESDVPRRPKSDDLGHQIFKSRNKEFVSSPDANVAPDTQPAVGASLRGQTTVGRRAARAWRPRKAHSARASPWIRTRRVKQRQ